MTLCVCRLSWEKCTHGPDGNLEMRKVRGALSSSGVGHFVLCPVGLQGLHSGSVHDHFLFYLSVSLSDSCPVIRGGDTSGSGTISICAVLATGAALS